MSDTKWLASLKAGDRIVVDPCTAHYGQKKLTATVKSASGRFIVTVDGQRWYRHNGYITDAKCGPYSPGYSWKIIGTVESLKEQRKRTKLLVRLPPNGASWHDLNLTTDQLRRIVAILDEPKE